jgi:hypothetical protein
MRLVAGCLVAIAMAAPAIAVGQDRDFDPCKNRGTRRIAIVFAKSSGILGRDGECRGNVYPEKKTVCVGDTVQWAVINACDVEDVADVRIQGLDRVAEKCTTVRHLGRGAATEIRCRIRRELRQTVKQEYEVAGRVGKGPTIIDPELEIRRPD